MGLGPQMNEFGYKPSVLPSVIATSRRQRAKDAGFVGVPIVRAIDGSISRSLARGGFRLRRPRISRTQPMARQAGRGGDEASGSAGFPAASR